MHYQITYAYTNGEADCYRNFQLPIQIIDILPTILNRLRVSFPDFTIESRDTNDSSLIAIVATW